MKVEIAIDPNAVASSLASRVAAAPAGNTRSAKPDAKSSAPRGRRAPRPRAPRPAKKTAEDLDAEMEVSSSHDSAVELTPRPTRRPLLRYLT
jgi:THO complex subunit 4